MKTKYKNNRSEQQVRQIERNRAKNAPRLKILKECMGCHLCGRLDVDGDNLDGHHYFGGRWKYKPLALLLGRAWQRIVREILGLDREKPNGGGPVVMWCKRYHQDYNKVGHRAKACTQLLKEGHVSPEKVPARAGSKPGSDKSPLTVN